ncbi:MAG: DUF4384 domain-containing protein [Desulfobacteraceae bacterium]|jgi:hypothetical protein|nr:DUF4384 domain-containing protein [Desulfobacteraceae bacterium]MBC2750853.1 DUF4384 domain-containing protein [Desulfobacteraceae bacterium]
MVHCKYITVMTVILATMVTAAQPVCAYGQNGQDAPVVHFVWAFGALVGPPDSRKLIAVDRDLALHSGDRLKFMVSQKTPCFVYLFHLSGKKELTLLYPPEFNDDAVQPGVVVLVPPDDRWFALDEETGTEKFYLLACHRRLSQLEDRYLHYLSVDKDADRQAAVEDIVETIKGLRRQHLRNTAPVERPIHLGGGFRGGEEPIRSFPPDLSAIAVEISASTFYSRTFTIDHR